MAGHISIGNYYLVKCTGQLQRMSEMPRTTRVKPEESKVYEQVTTSAESISVFATSAVETLKRNKNREAARLVAEVVAEELEGILTTLVLSDSWIRLRPEDSDADHVRELAGIARERRDSSAADHIRLAEEAIRKESIKKHAEDSDEVSATILSLLGEAVNRARKITSDVLKLKKAEAEKLVAKDWFYKDNIKSAIKSLRKISTKQAN